jgi:alpha-tubulin suppressor-like RCC1 family protein
MRFFVLFILALIVTGAEFSFAQSSVVKYDYTDLTLHGQPCRRVSNGCTGSIMVPSATAAEWLDIITRTTTSPTMMNSCVEFSSCVTLPRSKVVETGGTTDTGWDHLGATVALKDNGIALSWGYASNNGTHGQCILTSILSTPTRVCGGRPYTDIVAIGGGAIALGYNGKVYGWGSPLSRAGILTNQQNPTLINEPYSFIAIAASNSSICGIRNDYEIMCLGLDTGGRLGNGGGSVDSTVFTLVDNGPSIDGINWTQVTISDRAACGLKANGEIKCWGYSIENGDGTGGTGRQSPYTVVGGHSWTHVSANMGNHVCAVRSDAAAMCWGVNSSGELGNSSTADSSTPVLVSGGYSWSKVYAGIRMSCGIRTDGAAMCWGDNEFGNLGDGSTTDSSVPVLVSGGDTWSELSPSASHVCGVTTSNVVKCWGENQGGQLGTGDTTDSYTPIAITGGFSF